MLTSDLFSNHSFWLPVIHFDHYLGPIMDSFQSVGLELQALDSSGAIVTGSGLITATHYQIVSMLTGAVNPLFNLVPLTNILNPILLPDSGTISTDLSKGSFFTITIAGNHTLANPTNPVAGQKILWRIKQDATGNRTLTLDSKFRFGSDLISVVLSTTPNKTDYLSAIYNADDDKFDVLGLVRGY